jgi:predicted Zn-dependent protease
MRVARYDVAMSALGDIPARFSDFPGVPFHRTKVMIGVQSYRETPDWDAIGEDLKRLRAEHPRDADLMVLEARYWLRVPDYEKAGALAEQALKEDERNAEAWFVLGLRREQAGDAQKAIEHYRKALEAAPESPQYRNSLARALLETGKPDDALAEFKTIREFPLARLEEATAYWAKGDMRQAAAAQKEAASMLDNSQLASRYHNRREWTFRVPPGNNGVSLSTGADKACYAKLSEAASRSLAGESGVAFPPAGCEQPRKEVGALLADRLCRFVEKPQPAMAGTANRLRRSLGVTGACAA